jgi:hypothetical protein
MKANLRNLRKDGYLDETEAALLRAEAKRLHITIEELNVLLEQILIVSQAVIDQTAPCLNMESYQNKGYC